MAVTPVTFFDPSSPFGALTGWEVQSGGDPTKTKQRAQELNSTGDELAAQEYDKRSTVSAAYEPTVWSGETEMVIPKAGAILEGYHVDSIALAFTQTKVPVLTVTGHKHDDGKGHAVDSCRTYTPTPVFPVQGIGVPSALTDGGSPAVSIFSLEALATVGLRSLSYSLTVTHEDELDGGGAHLAGENRDGVESMEIEFTGGAVLGTDFTLDSNWFVETETPNQSNTAVKTKTFSVSQHIVKDA